MSNLSVNRSDPEARERAAEAADLSPFAASARVAFKAAVRLFAIGILIQVFLAGLGLFWNSAQWASHSGFAKVVIVISVLVLALSFIARVPLAIRLRSAGLLGLIVLIAVSAKLPSGIGYLSALHPVLALMLFYGTVNLVRKTGAPRKDKKQKAAEQIRNDMVTGFGGKQILLEDPAGNPIELFEPPSQKGE